MTVAAGLATAALLWWQCRPMLVGQLYIPPQFVVFVKSLSDEDRQGQQDQRNSHCRGDNDRPAGLRSDHPTSIPHVLVETEFV